MEAASGLEPLHRALRALALPSWLRRLTLEVVGGAGPRTQTSGFNPCAIPFATPPWIHFSLLPELPPPLLWYADIPTPEEELAVWTCFVHCPPYAWLKAKFSAAAWAFWGSLSYAVANVCTPLCRVVKWRMFSPSPERPLTRLAQGCPMDSASNNNSRELGLSTSAWIQRAEVGWGRAQEVKLVTALYVFARRRLSTPLPNPLPELLRRL